MKYLATLFLSLCVVAVSFAQTPAPAPSQHFVISANAAGYSGSAGTQAVSIVGTGFQVTKDISVAYGNISNPTDSSQPRYNLGDLNYSREVASLLGAKLTSKLVFDATNWIVTFQVSAGKVKGPGFNRIAEGGGIYLTRPVASNLAMTCGFRVLHGAGTSLVKVPTVGMQFTF